jgi:hypothetical protein
MSELGQWAEAKLRTVHRLRAALCSTDELPAAGRACQVAGRCCVGLDQGTQCTS